MGALVRESMVQGEQLKVVIKYHKGSNWTSISLQACRKQVALSALTCRFSPFES